ncbi:MAG: CPBP family intramembrane metalloprotease [Proteobacteria bacterium]|nr:CPBP family intramembrane metalloprotease [Pseudomonadota bacterium]
MKGHDERYLLNTALVAVSVIALTVLLSLLSRRHNLRYGLGGDRRWQNFAVGVFLGLGFLAAQLAAMFLLHVYAFGTGRSIDAALAYDAILYAALFLAVAVLEETTFRGYALVELSRAISFWPAALVMAVLFGVPHALQAGDNALGGFEAGLFGFAAAVAFRYTGSLWLAIGFHAAWDYGESFIFGVPDSGQFAAGRLLHPAIHGPDWLSGGSAGPEGSALATLPMLALIAFVWLRHRTRPAAITA